MVINNDNFRKDTLIGSAPQANRTDTMFVQPELKNKPVEAINIPDKQASHLSASLKELNTTMKDVTPYKTTGWAEPPLRTKPQVQEQLNTVKRWTLSVIHALARADDDIDQPEVSE